MTSRINIALFILLFLSVFSISAGYQWLIPKYEDQFKKILIEKTKSNPRSYFKLKPEKVSILFFPPQIKIINIELDPKPPLDQYITSTKIKKAFAYISIFNLIRKKLKISHVKVISADIILITDKSKSLKVKKKPIYYFNYLKRIPFKRISFEDINLIAQISQKDMLLKATSLSFTLEKQAQHPLDLTISVPDLKIREDKTNRIFPFKFEAKLGLSLDKIKIKPLKISKENSFFTFFGELDGSWLDYDYKKIQGNINTTLDLEDTQSIFKYFPEIQLPSLKGTVETKANFVKSSKNNIKLDFSLKTRKVFFKDFDFGTITAQGNYGNYLAKSNKNVSSTNISELSIKNSSGFLWFKNFQVQGIPLKDTS